MARKITSKRKVKKSVLIAFEDSKSSKYYFNDLLRDKNLKDSLYVHVLNLKSLDRDVLQKEIVDDIEKHLI